MHVYVEVAINLPQISDSFHYHLPSDLVGIVQPGSLVIVPFGKQRVQGLVLRFIETPEVADTRPVEEIVDEKPALTPGLMALAKWMAHETLASLGACINLMLPSGLSQRTDTLVHLREDIETESIELSPLEKRIVGLLKKRGDLRARQMETWLRHVEWRGTLRKLARRGIVETHSILPEPRVKAKHVRKVSLAIDPAKVEDLDLSLSRVHDVHDRRMEILKMLADQPGLVKPGQIYAETGAKHYDLKALEALRLIRIVKVQVWRDPLEDASFVQVNPPELTGDQKRVWETIHAGLAKVEEGDPPIKPYLLHGVTGSGKTEIYLRAVKETLAMGKRAIVLVPEISLTPQTVNRFLSRFPGQVGVMHSQLSDGERYDTWRRARNGELSIIVGPRSALFMPLEDLGLIVVDECHHESFDQSDREPYYRGVKTAVAFARLSGAMILLGSATPQVTQYYRAISGSWTYLELPKRILAHREAIAQHARRLGIEIPLHPGEGSTADLGLPDVSIVDMRQELRDGNRSIFSRELQSSIQEVLDTGQQAILFLNRLGTATYVFCRDCGHVIRCPHDDKPLTYHRSREGLLCHTCGYQRKIPKTCPVCGGKHIKQLGVGTEKVEQLVNQNFPGVRTLRWDTETTRAKGAHERILMDFSNHNADILIGTQMLTKGLDLPLVTLVGVILAEVGLNLPDYLATERTFQVLTQVAGRAGRSPLGGKVILQTYVPDNYAIRSAANHDFTGFYSREMAYRRDLGYPPFKRLVRLEYRHYDSQKAEKAAFELVDHLRTWNAQENRPVEIIGPAPCFFQRLSRRYRWQIVLRGDDPAGFVRDRQLPDWMVEVDPSSLL
ncbi:MAG: primosomal protein N' [Chloroflexota bacterium]|nr:primosomal protein N' [Chloroflexota bacterium]